MGKRIVLIGAGSAQFGYGTVGDILQSKVLQGSTIVLHDINPKTLEVVRQTAVDFINKNHLPFSVEATTNRAEAFHKADFLIISIEVGDRFNYGKKIGASHSIRNSAGLRRERRSGRTFSFAAHYPAYP